MDTVTPTSWVRAQPLTPDPPDFHICDQYYGHGIDGTDCVRIAGELPTGANPVQYTVNTDGEPRTTLPMSVMIGTCRISIDVAGQYEPHSVSIRPDRIRGMAAFVIAMCVLGPRGLGGFVTFGMSRVVNLINQPTFIDGAYGPGASFLTATVSGPMIRNPPGDFDPAIPSMLSDTQNRRATASVPWGIDRIRLGASANIFALRATAMRRGQEVPWWFTPLLASDEMTYECDANLGSPATVDCTQIQWHQLGALSNTVQVGPGETRFLSSNTCNLALSATVAVTLTWNQIQTALAALLNLCVSHPLYPSQGGRAFFGHPSPPIGRKKEKRDDITGLNALPPHINMTVFQQFEPVPTDALFEAKTCTWAKVLGRLNVASCKNV
ncbi:hypothetical protein MMC12_000434 [Toensbergia leucococca]|nr:hypothetical protein [Toensbergia leucococca]